MRLALRMIIYGAEVVTSQPISAPIERLGFFVYGPVDKGFKSPLFHSGVTGSNPVGTTVL